MLKYQLLCFTQKEEFGWNDMRVRKRWQHFNFRVKYLFKCPAKVPNKKWNESFCQYSIGKRPQSLTEQTFQPLLFIPDLMNSHLPDFIWGIPTHFYSTKHRQQIPHRLTRALTDILVYLPNYIKCSLKKHQSDSTDIKLSSRFKNDDPECKKSIHH